MSSPTPQPVREMVFCHQCQDEWFRDEHGLTCPHCHSDFVEVIEANNDPHDFHEEQDDEHWDPLGAPSPPGGLPGGFPGGFPGGTASPFNNMGPFGSPFSMFPPQQPANRAGPEYRHAEYRTPGGGVVVTSFSYSSSTSGSNSGNQQSQAWNSFGGLLQGVLGNIMASRATNAGPSPASPSSGSPLPGSPPPGFQHPFLRPRNGQEPQGAQHNHDPFPDIVSQFFVPQPGAARAPGSPPPGFQQHAEGEVPVNLMNMMRMILSGHPVLMGGHGDAAYSQEEFDRIMSQLLEQAQQGGGEPPASQEEIARIPKVTVDQAWLDKQENKDCSICMEEAKLGDEISELWCGHWYHPFCIKQWLDAHGACPLCRKTLRQSREECEAKNAKNARRERRRSSKPETSSRHSSMPDWRGYRDDGQGSSRGNEGGAGDAGSSSGGIRDRLSNLFRGTSR